MVIIDTDILIDVGRGDNTAISCLEGIDKSFHMAVSTVTQMELIVGCRDKSELRNLNYFLQRFRIIRIDELISEKAVKLLTTWRLSHGLLIADAIIAATAIITDVQFITKNQKDFRFIDDLNLLSYPNPF
jgi:predicted nucleic acid-binding protein